MIGINPFLLENLTHIDVAINYFDTKHLLSGIQPFLGSIFIFILLKKYLVKNYEGLQYDIYRKMARLFVTTGYELSNFHDGKLNEYLLWTTSTLIILLLLLMF